MTRAETQRSTASERDLRFFRGTNRAILNVLRLTRLSGVAMKYGFGSFAAIGAIENFADSDLSSAAKSFLAFGSIAVLSSGISGWAKHEQPHFIEQVRLIDEELATRTDERYAQAVYGEAAPLVLDREIPEPPMSPES